ncbi:MULTISPECIES: GNAT family N-acetyltransferase [Kitasatospora]|uniref:GNAT family N-acetyltransferase n=1 Tax=Kitasatospora TaxID=2063 RepID=UPI000C70C756|nr:GNAT family N-acetyltransferase [Kitasatospora sp. GP30]MDH6142226.1 GNAT superfamily N-acetyltransferase [Kitasatospora sp. GP30]
MRITALTDPDPSPTSRRLAWLAEDEAGHPIGSAFLRLPTAAGRDHLGELMLAVHPADRRAGVGSALLAQVVAAAGAEQRRCVIAQVEEGSPGDAFLADRGFRRAATLEYVRLALDSEAPPVPHGPDGYQLLHWDGMVSDELAEAFVAARSAMDDMPIGEADFGRVVWDVPRMRAAADAVAARGELLCTMAAVETASGEFVGFTELVLAGDGTGDAQHYGTAVRPEHRGRGIARWLKAAQIDTVRAEFPRLAGLLTDTAEENAAMRRVNAALGYRTTHRTHLYQLDLS